METFSIGDAVLWRGILLMVTAIRTDGYVEATSPTMRVLAALSQFTHCGD